MALTADEQKFYDFAKSSLPDWIPDGDEFLMGAAKMFGSVKALLDYLFGQALIGTAEGGTATTPDWLNQHARDRGTSRVDGEDDPTLRDRLRNAPDAITRASILVAVNAILVAAGISGSAGMVELPKHGAHSGEYGIMSGTGVTIAVSGTTARLTPDELPWARPPFFDPALVPFLSTKIFVNTIGGNAGVFTITGLDGNAAVYTNATAIAGSFPTVPWNVRFHDPEGNVRNGYARAFSQRGYRSARLVPLRIVIILPYGSTAAVEASVREALRQKKAAGIAVTVERRTIAP